MASEPDPASLLGTWTWTRRIKDRAENEVISVVGASEFAPEPDGRIRWSESGTMTRRGVDVPVTRTLFLESRGDGWFVTFEDGRDFHPWSPGETVEHPCAADLYVGTVRVGDERTWSVEWRVTGPAKDYVMTTELTRATTP